MSAPVQNSLMIEQSPVMALEVQAARALTVGSSTQSIAGLMELAIEKNMPVESLEKLFGLYERMAAREAVQQFNDAMAAFQRECPSIKKNKTADVKRKDGGSFGYTYADLPEIKNTVDPVLAKHGFSYSWDSEPDAKGLMKTTCILSHIGGHSKSSSLALPTENAAAMSPQQKFGAALTYAERRTLANVLGITIEEVDPEAVKSADPTMLDEDAVREIEEMLTEADVDRAAFLRVMGASTIAELRAAEYEKAKKVIQKAATAARARAATS